MSYTRTTMNANEGILQPTIICRVLKFTPGSQIEVNQRNTGSAQGIPAASYQAPDLRVLRKNPRRSIFIIIVHPSEQ